MTPRDLKLVFRGAQDRIDREHNRSAWLAWHVAVLGRQKKIPPLDRMLAKPRERPRQTWQEAYQVMNLLAARVERAQKAREQIKDHPDGDR